MLCERQPAQYYCTCAQLTPLFLCCSLNNATDTNSSDEEQEQWYQDTLRRLQPWQDKIAVHRMLTAEAAASFANSSIDFIYLDAHHDFCGTKEDMQLYWPKLRPGGIMAGDSV